MRNIVDIHNKGDKENNDCASIIIPTYNRAAYITKALNSVWMQTYRPIELLIVDDGSTDDTKNKIYEWIVRHKTDELFITKYIHQENKGAPAARNTGIRNARGRYLQFLDSDDMLLPEKLTLQIDIMKREKTPLCICDYIRVDDKDNIISMASNNRSMKEIIKEYTALSTSIGVIDKSFFEDDILQWNPNLVRAQDRDFNLKLFMVIDEFSYVEKYLFKWVTHDGESITSSPKDLRKIRWDGLISLLRFSLKYYRHISYKKITSIMFLYTKLFYHSLIIGPIPKFLKFWKKSSTKRIKTFP